MGGAVLFAAMLAALASPGFAQSGRRPLSPDAQRIERQLDRMENDRRDILAERSFGWEENFRPFELKEDPSADRRNAVVELSYQGREVPCFVRFEKTGDAKAEPVYAPLLVPGSQWLRLGRGTWNVRVFAGYATGPIVEFPTSPVKIEAGKVYRFTFGPDEELLAKDLTREQVRRQNEKRAERSVQVSPSR